MRSQRRIRLQLFVVGTLISIKLLQALADQLGQSHLQPLQPLHLLFVLVHLSLVMTQLCSKALQSLPHGIFLPLVFAVVAFVDGQGSGLLGRFVVVVILL